MRKLSTILLVVFIMFNSSFSLSAESEQPFISYSLDYSTLTNDDLKDYITSIQAVQDGGGYQIQVGENGEKYVAGYISGNSGTVSFTPHNINLTGNVVISVDIDSKTASVNYTTTRVTEYFHTATVRIYPSPLSEDTTMWCDIYLDGTLQDTRKANPTDNEFHFGSYSHTFAPDAVINIDDIYINSSGYAVVESTQIEGGVISRYMGNGTRELEIFMETHVPAQELELDYLRLLTLLDWDYAKQETAHYSNAQINQALASSSITLKNNGTGLTTNERLVTTITYWERLNNGAIIGDGIYNTQVAPRQVQVICQYYDNATEDCSSVKSLPRYYAVIADNYSYGTVDKNPGKLDRNERIWESKGEGLSFPTWERNEDLKYQYQFQTANSYDSGWLTKDDYNREKNDNENFHKVTNEQTRDGTKYSYYQYGSWTDWYLTRNIPATSWYRYYGTYNYEEQTGSTMNRYKYATQNTTYSGWVSETPSSGAYPYVSYDYQNQYACADYQYADYSQTVNGKSGSYQSECRVYASYQQDVSSICGYRDMTGYKCPTSKNVNSCNITSDQNATLCAYSFTNYGTYETSKYGYTGKCLSRTGNNAECGVASYSYTYGAWQKTKYGRFQSNCKWRFGRNPECGGGYCRSYQCPISRTTNYNRCTSYKCPQTRNSQTCNIQSETYCGASYTYGDYSLTKYGSYLDKCNQYNGLHFNGYYKSCVVYTCPQSRHLGSYSAWSTSSCSGDSQLSRTVYNYKNVTVDWSEWSSWSASNVPSWVFNAYDYETDTDIQTRSRTRVLATTDWMGGNSCTGSGCPRQEDIVSTMSYKTTYGEWFEFRGTFWSWSGKYSQWFDVPDSQTTGYSAENIKYRYRIMEAQTINKPVDADFAIEGTVTIGTKPKQTYSDVVSQAHAMDKADADQQLLSLVRNGALSSKYNKLGNEHILWSEFSNAKSGEYSSYIAAANNSISGDTWLASKSFVPYIYITDHIRANYVDKDIVGYSEDSGNMNVSLTEVRRDNNSKSSSGILVQDDNRSALNTKVVYLDFNTPLKKYEGNLPDNWDGEAYNKFVEAIANAKLNDMEGEIRIKMSLQDMRDMREYLKEHPDSLGDCDFLKEFSHIFESTSSDLSAFLSGSDSCRITEEPEAGGGE